MAKALAPHARKVRVRHRVTGECDELWPVDARERVEHPLTEWELVTDVERIADAPTASAKTEEVARDASASHLEQSLKLRALLEDKSYAELQALAKHAGLPAGGKRSDLVEALLPHVNAGTVSLESVMFQVATTARRFES